MLRVDLAALEIDAPVGELAAWPPGPPRPGGWFATARAAEGARIHREYQEEARRGDPSYTAEVPVSLVVETAGFSLRLHGRADGVRRAHDGALVAPAFEHEAERRRSRDPAARVGEHEDPRLHRTRRGDCDRVHAGHELEPRLLDADQEAPILEIAILDVQGVGVSDAAVGGGAVERLQLRAT